MNKDFIVENYQGSKRDFVTFPGLLDEAHNQGLKRVTETIVQIPDKDNGNFAIVVSEVETSKGTFTGIGDASPGNVGSMVAKHVLRMAATRATARAFRTATNIGMTSLEELGGEPESKSSYSALKATVKKIADKNGVKQADIVEELRSACNFTGQVSDLSDEKREEIADYLEEKYG